MISSSSPAPLISTGWPQPAPDPSSPLCLDSQLQNLDLFQAQVEYNAAGSEVFGLFKADPSLPGVILMEGGQFRGMLPRQRFYEHITSYRYSIDVFWNRSIQTLHRFFTQSVLILPGTTLIPTAAQQALQRPAHQIYEPLVVQLSSDHYQLLDAQVLLLAQAQIHQLTSEALQLAEARNQALLEVIPDLLLRIDHQGRVLDLRGDTRLVDSALTPVCLGSFLLDTLPQPLAAQLSRSVHQTLSTRADDLFETELDLEGSQHLFEVRVVLINPQEILAIIRDITAKRQQEEYLRTLERNRDLEVQMQEMRRLHQLKDNFLSTVSHELRTPITSMKMSIELLKVASDPESQQRYLDILSQECQREIALITDLLDLQQLEAGVRPKQLETLEFDLWLRALCEPFEYRTQERQQYLQVQIEPSETGLFLTTDKAVLQRVISELLTNACKYTPPQGQIWVRAQAQDDRICLQVSNTCESPIPEEELPRLFDKFYRVPSGDPWRQGGTGLGLALIRQAIEWLGGSIRVLSGEQALTLQVELISLNP